MIFKAAGFTTERDKLFSSSSGVRHEIDVWAIINADKVAIECKDWARMTSNILKKELGEFRSKVSDIGAITGIFAINQPDDGRFQLYKKYLRENGLFLWDKDDVEKWKGKMGSSDYRKELYDYLGLSQQSQTKGGKMFGFLKSDGMSTALKKNREGSLQISSGYSRCCTKTWRGISSR